MISGNNMNIKDLTTIFSKISVRDAGIIGVVIIFVLGSVYTADKNEKVSLLFFFSALLFACIFVVIYLMDTLNRQSFNYRLNNLDHLEKKWEVLKQNGVAPELLDSLLVKDYESLYLKALKEKQLELAEGLKNKIEEFKK